MIDTIIFGYSDRKMMTFSMFRELLTDQEKRLGTRTRKSRKGLGASKRRRRSSRSIQYFLSNSNTLKPVSEWGRIVSNF